MSSMIWFKRFLAGVIALHREAPVSGLFTVFTTDGQFEFFLPLSPFSANTAICVLNYHGLLTRIAARHVATKLRCFSGTFA